MLTKYSSSGVHHLEEIREAGYPMPSVNQIEVIMSCLTVPRSEFEVKNALASSFLPATSNSGILQSQFYRCTSLQSLDSGKNGSSSISIDSSKGSIFSELD